MQGRPDIFIFLIPTFSLYCFDGKEIVLVLLLLTILFAILVLTNTWMFTVLLISLLSTLHPNKFHSIFHSSVLIHFPYCILYHSFAKVPLLIPSINHSKYFFALTIDLQNALFYSFCLKVNHLNYNSGYFKIDNRILALGFSKVNH